MKTERVSGVDEILKAIKECPIENIIFSYMKDSNVKSYLKSEDPEICLNMALLVVRHVIRDQVNDGYNPDVLRIQLLQAVNKFFDEVKYSG